jgi:hypothetical protein
MKFSEGGLAGEGEIADSKLFDLVIAADEEALSEGLSPKQRAMATVSKIMKQLGYASFAMAGAATPAIVQRIQAIHRSLYRDLTWPSEAFTVASSCSEMSSRG